MEYKEIKPGLENKEELKKMKEKERTNRMAAAKQCRKFRKQVICRDTKIWKNTAVEQSINYKLPIANVSNLILLASLYTTTFDFK